MGIYGNYVKSLIENQNNIKIELQYDTTLDEANITIGDKKGVESVLYIRTSTQVTSGATPSNNDSESKMNHAESIKLKFDNTMIPIEIYSGKAKLRTDLYKGNKFIELNNRKKKVENFVNKNIDDIKGFFNSKGNDIETQTKLLKSIIDRSDKDIVNISSAPKDVIEYFKDTKKGK